MNADILNAEEFIFSPYESDKQGDSGTLLLTTLTSNSSEQYIVKFETPELACNEIYPTWLSNYYPDFILFRKAECKRFLLEIGR